MSAGRIARRFAALAGEGRAGLVAFVTAGDPDAALSLEIACGLAGGGADLIELGMPFTDPMADGPVIQAASQRALKAGMTLAGVLELTRALRRRHRDTPIVLMGYYNPIYRYGGAAFARDAAAAGADGLIVVDLPAEEEDELALPALAAGLDWVRLATPTSDDRRLPVLLKRASGFVYYVSIAGITGAATGDARQVARAVARLRAHTRLPVAVGFGIASGEQAAAVARSADAAVVGSAFCQAVADGLEDGKGTPACVANVLAVANRLAAAVAEARR